MTSVTFCTRCRAQSAGGSGSNELTEHLSDAQIDRYVSRRAPVDELLEVAQHLDACFDCRDRAAALVDSGTNERSHTRTRPPSGPHVVVADETKRDALLPLGAALVVVALILWWWLSS